MATIERYLEALKALQGQTAMESFDPGPSCQTEYQFGVVCGIQKGLRMAEELLNKQLEDPEDQNDGNVPRRNTTHRSR